MGVNYDQKCMIGFSVYVPDITVVVSEAIWEDQNRYDPRTGKVIKTERVIVKHAELKYAFMGRENDDWMELMEALAKELDLSCFAEHGDFERETFYIGEFVGDEYNCGNVDLLTGEVDMQQILSLHDEIKSKCNLKICLHFLTNVG